MKAFFEAFGYDLYLGVQRWLAFDVGYDFDLCVQR